MVNDKRMNDKMVIKILKRNLKKDFCFLISLMIFFGIFLNLNFISATTGCNLNINLINQDPHPGVPGEGVKVVFQVTGVENSACGIVTFEVKEDFPFSVDPGTSSRKSIQSGTFVRDYQSFWLVPYTLRVNKDAKEGANNLEVLISSSGKQQIKNFDIEIKNVITDFEIGIRDYNPTTREITFEILNIGGNDVEALVLEIPSQEGIGLIGSNRNIIGILDSNEDTSARFRISEVEEGEIEIIVRYNDKIDERREITKEVYFNPNAFQNDLDESFGLSISTYILIILILVLIVHRFYKRKKKKKELRG